MTVIDSMNHILETINKHYGKVYTQQFVIDLSKAISKLSQQMLLKDIEQSIILDIQFGVARGLTFEELLLASTLADIMPYHEFACGIIDLTDFWELDSKLGQGVYTTTKEHQKTFLMFS